MVIIMVKGTNFISVNEQTNLDVGSLVEGYTYSPSDFHSKEKILKRFQGSAKLRTGVIIENYDNMFFKVQFRNSSALKAKNNWFVNKINMKVADKDFSIIGSDMYCIIVDRKQIVGVSIESTYICDDINELQNSIFKKHSRWRKRSTMFFRNKLYLSKPNSVTNNVLKFYQFTPVELKMANSVIYKKFRLIWLRHISKFKCVEHEICKMKQAIKLIENNEELHKMSIMILELINHNHNIKYQNWFDEKNAISAIIEYFDSKSRYE